MTTGGESLNLRITACLIDVEGESFDAVSIVDISGEKNRRMLERVFFHDIMNVASSVQGFLDILPEQMQEDPKTVSEILHILANSAGDLIDLIKSQKDLLAAENNEFHPYIKEINAGQLLLNIQRFFQRNDFFKDRQIEIDGAEKELVFESDERILRRIIINAVKNALEAVSQGGSVILRYQDEDDSILFEVFNSSYIPEEIQSRIFRKSFSTKSKDRGIGTYRIKLFTEKYLHGMAWFISEKEHGTTFYIKVPKHTDRQAC